MWRKAKSAVHSSLAVIGATTVVFGGGTLAFKYSRKRRADSVLPRTVLTLDLSRSLREGPCSPTETIVGALSGKPPPLSMMEVHQGLKAAREDDSVAGIVVRLGSGEPIPLSQVQELRREVKAFTAGGKKFAFAFGDTYSKGHYYLASAFDRVYVEPTGEVDLSGVGITPLFFRGLLDKLKVKPNAVQAYEYKGALNMFTDKTLSKYHRENYEAIIDSILNQYVSDIARSRKLSAAGVRALFDRPALPAAEAKREGLVDMLGYASHVKWDLSYRARGQPLPDWNAEGEEVCPEGDERGQEASFLAFEKYADILQKRRRNPGSAAPHVALVFAEGPIQRFAAENDGKRVLGPAVVATLAKLAQDDSVKAVVLRVQSPGGDAIASDSIAYAVRELCGAKPVVASMGAVAASGGYYISAPATEIFANGATITGSIGVAGGKFVVGETLEEIGVTNDVVELGHHAGMNSALREYTEEEWVIIRKRIGDVYNTFIETVAAGRKMDPKKVHEVAKGRVWTGKEALSKGLVDRIGGLADALDRAMSLAVEEDDALKGAGMEVVVYPKPRNFMSMIFNSSEEARDFYACVGDSAPSHALTQGTPQSTLTRVLWSAVGSALLGQGQTQVLTPPLGIIGEEDAIDSYGNSELVARDSEMLSRSLSS